MTFRDARRPILLAAMLLALSSRSGPAAAQEDASEPAAPAAPRRPGQAEAARARSEAGGEGGARTGTGAPAKSDEGKPNAVWPAGALSINENYGAWSLSCNRSEASTTCMLLQSQGDNKTGKRLFAFEMRTPKDGRSEGLILMPFGLAIEPGVTFKLDDAVLGKGAPYVSCGNEGCLVPISFPALATDAMRTAKTLTVIGLKSGTNEPQPISVPLGGFAPVWDRAVALSG